MLSVVKKNVAVRRFHFRTIRGYKPAAVAKPSGRFLIMAAVLQTMMGRPFGIGIRIEERYVNDKIIQLDRVSVGDESARRRRRCGGR